MTVRQTDAGIHEFVFGALQSERAAMLRFWQQLGFFPRDEGSLDATRAGELYGHPSPLASLRLEHKGCGSFGTGYVRLQFWKELRNDGLGSCPPITTGSRWMGLYTEDILQLRDSITSRTARDDWQLWISPLVNAPLMQPAPSHDFFTPFVGLRETLVFGTRFRLAFIQRAGFERPGFGTFDRALPFKNTEGSHANIVQPANAFSTAFYKAAFDFETAPYGEAHDSGGEKETIEALRLRDGELFRVERTRAVDCPTGLLQVYSSYQPSDDLRVRSSPGCGNLCAYSIRIRSLQKLATLIDETPGADHLVRAGNEFGEETLTFNAPDGYSWIAVQHD